MITSVEYQNKVQKEFELLIEQRRNSRINNESLVQKFLEENPSILIRVLNSLPNGYKIYGNIVISKPRIYGDDFSAKVPDFLIITCNSLELTFHFIEIEDPRLRFFTKKSNLPSGAYTHAFRQVNSWMKLDDGNKRKYCEKLLGDLFADYPDRYQKKIIDFTYTLIYGSSDEFTSDKHRNEIVKDFKSPVYLVTFSRLIRENRGIVYPLFTVRKDSNGYNAVGMIPFKKYEGDCVFVHRNIREREDLIRASSVYEAHEKTILLSSMKLTDSKSVRELFNQSSGFEIHNFSDLDLDFLW